VIVLSNVAAKRAVRVLSTWRRVVFVSNVDRTTGLVKDTTAVRDLADFDAVLADLAEALKKAKQR